jgi:hypothetical protein
MRAAARDPLTLPSFPRRRESTNARNEKAARGRFFIGEPWAPAFAGVTASQCLCQRDSGTVASSLSREPT